VQRGVCPERVPDRDVTLIVPFAAGGTTDVVGRIIAKGVTEITGQAVIVDNRGGANGIIGTRELIRKDPDGYTLLMARRVLSVWVMPHGRNVRNTTQWKTSPRSCS